MGEILSAEEVARWLANVADEYPGAADALAEHDAAMRRRRAEVEQALREIGQKDGGFAGALARAVLDNGEPANG